MAIIRFKALVAKPFKFEDLHGDMARELRSFGRTMQSDFESTVSTWHHKPEFRLKLEQSPSYLRVVVGTNAKVYEYVSKGTRPHTIRARRRSLRFRSGYSSKTVPGRIPARGGGARGSYVFRPQVRHPGTEARNFPDLIVDARQPAFAPRIQAAINRWAAG